MPVAAVATVNAVGSPPEQIVSLPATVPAVTSFTDIITADDS